MGDKIKPGQIKMQFSMKDLKDRFCECGCKAFTQLYGLKELPLLMSSTGHPETMQLHIGFVCLGCGKPMSMRPGEPAPGDAIDITPGKPEPEKEKSIIEVVGG